VGAAKIVNDQVAPESVAGAVAHIAPEIGRPAAEPEPLPAEGARVERATADDGVVKAELPIVVEPVPEPSTEPSPQVEQPPVEEPPADPSPEPSPTEPPPPPPAPPWSFAFTTSTASVESCACSSGGALVGSQVQPTAGGFTFSETVRGGALDAAGDTTWPFSLQQWGEVNSAGGALDFRATLTTGGGRYLYAGSASLAEVTELQGGGTQYRFEGTFDLLNGGQPVAGVPWRGFVSATVLVWEEGTIYGGSLALTEAAG
jgi:hypothetical protein